MRLLAHHHSDTRLLAFANKSAPIHTSIHPRTSISAMAALTAVSSLKVSALSRPLPVPIDSFKPLSVSAAPLRRRLSVRAAAKDNLENARDDMGNKAKEAWESAKQKAGEAGQTVQDNLKSAQDNVTGAARDAGDRVQSGLDDATHQAGMRGKEAQNATEHNARGAAGTVQEGWENAKEGLGDASKNVRRAGEDVKDQANDASKNLRQ
jgi:hypothetical protein